MAYRIKYKIVGRLKPTLDGNSYNYSYIYDLYTRESRFSCIPFFTYWKPYKIGLTEDEAKDIVVTTFGDETIIESTFME